MPKILVIEDISSLRDEIIEVLTYQGFDTLAAENGKEGVEIARSQLPDLIICDVRMPIMDGYATLEAIQSQPITAEIPFIFLTAHSDSTQIRRGMDLGADDYLTKPFSIENLTSMVTTRLKKKEYLERKLKSTVDRVCSSISRALPHELRTPLNAIMGFSELLSLELEDRPELQEMADGIYASSQTLFKVIQNFLLYAELEVLANKNIILNDKTTLTQNEIGTSAQTKAQEMSRLSDLHLNLIEAKVRVSKSKLIKIVEEITSNSFKFSNLNTPVEISSQVGDGKDRDSLIITFTDYGRGMTSEQIKNIFAYMQFDRNIYEQQGTGLGLAIAKLLAKLHGGELEIQSELGIKTTVKLILPLARD